MKTNILIGIILFLSFSSCNRVLLFVLGAEQPKYKTDEDVKEYAQKVFDYEGDILRLKSFNEDSNIPLGITNMPAIMYADNGSLNKYHTTCSADYSKIIESYDKDISGVEIDTSFFSDDIENNLYSISGEEISIEEPTFLFFMQDM